MKIRNLLFLAVILLFVACGSGSGGTGDTASTIPGSNITEGLNFTAAANFSASAVASVSKSALKTTTGVCADLPDLTMDGPALTNGLDCDGDGGRAAHVTPSKYALAFKRVTLLAQSGGTNIDIIADTGTLARSDVVDFTDGDSTESVVTIDASDLSAGTYTGIEAEIYYFQLTFSVAGVTRNVRIYMSDDDFSAEGSLGHHQGDVTLVNDDGTELGWVDYTWALENLATSRSDNQTGAGGTDSETGHARGFFGNDEFWNAAPLRQGANQDIYIETLTFDSPLVVPDPSTITDITTITATFSVADTFYYEDFPPYDSTDYPGFYPDTGGEAADVNREWAPAAPTAVITYD